ncbi:energy-coupling factor ABC transporter permease [Patescibacteria group bacterium]|nr:energy-coupling factor ABC transporter permease [Patescibacteria group bacterium]MBU1951613.1 energy-coupling factor ABC transporter permease [Patescibacteria group bacterium]MBU2236057.1 energy-coupling factor ABC transporter permease [Patescibacteria group bacterium]
MHIPDGFLGPGTSTTLVAAALGAVSFAFSKIRKGFFAKQRKPALVTPEGIQVSSGGNVTMLTKYGRDKIFRMATVASFIFAAQMINFPIADGTSGHLLGGVLAAVLLGPLEGLIVVSAVLVIQSLLFADGGLVALGANIFNMGVIGTIAGYYIYTLLKKYLKHKLPSVFIAAWLSVSLASIGASAELALSNTIAFSAVFPAMVGVHALIGIGEGMITLAVIWYMREEKSNE